LEKLLPIIWINRVLTKFKQQSRFQLADLGIALTLFVGSSFAAPVADERSVAEVSQKFSQLLNLGVGDSVALAELDGEKILAWNEDSPLIPASTLKILTAYMALQKWGAEHRFYTDFYLHQGQLWVKGFGDPFITSEELELVALAIKQRLNEAQQANRITQIWVDGRFFAQQSVPGTGNQIDPYNAPVSAVAANFNTVKLRINAKGALESAEEQTPLTSVARAVADQRAMQVIRSKGAAGERINLRSSRNAELHFAEILRHKLGLTSEVGVYQGALPDGADLLYRHYNSKPLTEQLRGALYYSNNFIANQIFLMLPPVGDVSAEGRNGVGRDIRASARYVQKYLRQELMWRNFMVDEGAGLSRTNRLSAAQLLDVLRYFEPNKSMLRAYRYEVNGHKVEVLAKTGTLKGIRTLAGYFRLQSQDYIFSIMLTEGPPFGHREEVLRKMVELLLN
jgi:D-alanyl-D-alanine carboxypeptidase/D-alanyl-D-alanine-endopeptidase (penicillin-binding protein 4)